MTQKICLLILIVFLYTKGYAQDSLRTLNAEQVISLVRSYHPVVKQANIQVDKSKADILTARAAFDPIISTYATQKTFNGTNYYTYVSPEIKIPTWFGIEIYSGLESLSGNRLDPTQSTGQTSYLGISVPLIKNLVIDKRRAFLRQAKIFKSMAIADQKATVNDLLMEAMEAYWTWVKSYQTYKVIEQNVEINRKRLALVTASYRNGERPAIDTIEALTQLQSFEYEKNAYWLDFQNTGLELSAFLWTKDEMPYVLPENIVPQDGWENEVNIAAFNLSLENLLTAATINHPDLQFYDYKLEALQIDKKMKLQELLPKLDVSYNQLGKDFNLLKTTVTGPLFRNNFQYGLKFEMPLRFSQGRGDYRNAKLKIAETELGQSQKQLQIAIKIKSYYNEFETLKKQVALQSENYNNYQRLVKAEESRLTNGESSLFVVNARETKALEAYEKLIALKTKYFKTVYALQWSAGLLQ